MVEEDGEQKQEPLKVTFVPALYLQRRMWVLDVLRREDVTSVLDVGCGEGELLACLAQPAPWLRSPLDSIRFPQPLLATTTGPLSEPNPDTDSDEIANLHCMYLKGLDVSLSDLRYAVHSTAPLSPPQPPVTDPDVNISFSSAIHSVRWESLEVKIWHGGLESINPEFVGVECIVSTEVIEHLPPDVLPSYAPMLLGVYHPRLLLITTPSYTFNARFTPPNVSERAGYPDPTNRTNRIFRHHDHKLEFTLEEFAVYCHDAAEQWGYDVVVDAVGRALEKDPWGREEACGGASQVAEFKRREGREIEEARKLKAETFLREKAASGKHELLATHIHSAHLSSQRPSSLDAISASVKLKMENSQESVMRFEELWFEQDISTLCGGWIELLADAVEADDELILRQIKDGAVSKSRKREDWRVELVGGVQKKEVLWEQETVEPYSGGDLDGLTGGDDAKEHADVILKNTSGNADVFRGWGVVDPSSSWGDESTTWGSSTDDNGKDEGNCIDWGSHPWGSSATWTNLASGTSSGSGSGWGNSTKDL